MFCTISAPLAMLIESDALITRCAAKPNVTCPFLCCSRYMANTIE